MRSVVAPLLEEQFIGARSNGYDFTIWGFPALNHDGGHGF